VCIPPTDSDIVIKATPCYNNRDIFTERIDFPMAANKNAKHSKNSNAQKGTLSKSTVIAFAVAIVFFILLGTRFFSTDKGSETGAGSDFNINADYYADIELENYGTITVALDATAAPITVENFVSLAKSGFYDGLTFHRIIEGYMMQGGDPKGNGTGGSGTNIKGEFSSNGVDNPLSHTRGAISMARAKANDSASSQFFIMHQDYTAWDGNYAVFGYVTEGIEIVDQVCADAQPTDNNGTIPPEAQPVIKTITIRE